jgi:hypothetical protein
MTAQPFEPGRQKRMTFCKRSEGRSDVKLRDDSGEGKLPL